MADILRKLRDLALDVRESVAFVRSLPPSELLWIYERIGIDKPPGEKGRVFAAKTKKKRRLLASKVPIEVHAAIMRKLWPKIYGDRWPPRRAMNVTTAAEAVSVMEGRAAAGKGLWHPKDVVEITDRKRLFHRQGHQFAPGDSTRRKNGRCKYKPSLSKRMTQPTKTALDEAGMNEMIRPASLAQLGNTPQRSIPDNELRKLYANGQTLTEVADIFGANRETVRLQLVSLGIARRPAISRDRLPPNKCKYLCVPKLANLDAAKRKTVVQNVCKILKEMRAGKNGKGKVKR